MTSGIPSTDHISSLTHLLHSHLDEELGGELNRAGLDSRLSALPVCPKMRLGEPAAKRTRCAPVGRGISHRTGAIEGVREHLLSALDLPALQGFEANGSFLPLLATHRMYQAG